MQHPNSVKVRGAQQVVVEHKEKPALGPLNAHRVESRNPFHGFFQHGQERKRAVGDWGFSPQLNF